MDTSRVTRIELAAAFKKGQMVRARFDGVRSAFGHRFDRGDEVVVADPKAVTRHGYPNHTLGVGTPTPGVGEFDYLVNPSEFELVPTAPQWSDVEAGDKVKVRLKATGQEVDTEAYREPGEGAEYVRVLGYATHVVGPVKYDLLSIEKAKPKPKPPTTPGSVVLIHSGSPAWPNGLPLLRQGNGRWIGQANQSWSDEDVAYANGGDFEVIHDAGKDA